MPSVTPGSWTCRPQTHRSGVHCRWPVTQVVGGISPSASLWTCTVAGEAAGNSVSYFHIYSFPANPPPLTHSLTRRPRAAPASGYLAIRYFPASGYLAISYFPASGYLALTPFPASG